ncbi:glutathione S-transferase N-terminal domain-containing protein [Brevundimonas bacteroides]|uniref:glutathione S-transferase N-terminal domain-containing protein n=1 Tax=Brevundimonas bacteroides TaxID=74311 RepID=UPI0004966E43|nr:glutathione S-transferase N-terminal domain-containing protein [Brevundimonas bacteroides]
MKLFIAPPSPFARKCRIVVREKGLLDRVEEVLVNPYESPDALLAVNPIAQVPALLTDGGEAILDSPVICEWLDRQGAGPVLLPIDGPERWRVKQVEGLAAAVLEMGVKLVLEKRRPESERSPSWMMRWIENMGRALDALEAAGVAAEPLDMGVITAGCAVTWLDFRHPDYDWKAGRPGLVALQAELETRPSFRETAPA